MSQNKSMSQTAIIDHQDFDVNNISLVESKAMNKTEKVCKLQYNEKSFSLTLPILKMTVRKNKNESDKEFITLMLSFKNASSDPSVSAFLEKLKLLDKKIESCKQILKYSPTTVYNTLYKDNYNNILCNLSVTNNEVNTGIFKLNREKQIPERINYENEQDVYDVIKTVSEAQVIVNFGSIYKNNKKDTFGVSLYAVQIIISKENSEDDVDEEDKTQGSILEFTSDNFDVSKVKLSPLVKKDLQQNAFIGYAQENSERTSPFMIKSPLLRNFGLKEEFDKQQNKQRSEMERATLRLILPLISEEDETIVSSSIENRDEVVKFYDTFKSLNAFFMGQKKKSTGFVELIAEKEPKLVTDKDGKTENRVSSYLNLRIDGTFNKSTKNLETLKTQFFSLNNNKEIKVKTVDDIHNLICHHKIQVDILFSKYYVGASSYGVVLKARRIYVQESNKIDYKQTPLVDVSKFVRSEICASNNVTANVVTGDVVSKVEEKNKSLSNQDDDDSADEEMAKQPENQLFQQFKNQL